MNTTSTPETATSKKLRDSVAYVVSAYHAREQAPLTRTKLVKFLYLADLRSTEKRHRPVTGIEYRSYFYGPYAPEILEAAESQPQYVLFERRQRADGAPYYAYSPTAARPKASRLSEGDRQVLDEVLEEFGKLSLRKLLREVYQTEPFKKAEMLQPIDLSS